MASLKDTIVTGDLRVTGSAYSTAAQVTTINGVTVGSSPKFTDTTYESKAAASGGTAVSLVTTGEKYTWNQKQTALVSGTNIKTVNNTSLLGSGNITISGGASLLDVYPVGAIYMSVVNTSPATLFGGTWEQIKDMFLLAAGDTYAAGSTGGEATHVLTENEMPSHNHSYTTRGSMIDADCYKGSYLNATTAGPNTGNKGGGQAHNNMPPYLTVYVWKRTA